MITQKQILATIEASYVPGLGFRVERLELKNGGGDILALFGSN